MEITLSNGKGHFYQWDTGQSIQVPEGVPTVHFKMHGEGVAFQAVDRMVAVPDELLQLKNDIILPTAHGFMSRWRTVCQPGLRTKHILRRCNYWSLRLQSCHHS